MEIKRLNSGKLRAIGYDVRAKLLRVELDDGRAIEYAGVSQELWRRFANHATPWSFYRDQIEEELHGKRAAATVTSKSRPVELDALFAPAPVSKEGEDSN